MGRSITTITFMACPKKWMKRKGKWVETPPLPEDYHTNAASAAAYDRMVEGKG